MSVQLRILRRICTLMLGLKGFKLDEFFSSGSQEQSNQSAGPPVFITVRRRSTPLDSVGGTIGLSEEQKEIFLRERRAALVREYNNITDPTLQRLLSLCAPLLNMDVDIERKYVELDLRRVFEANKVGTAVNLIYF